MSNIYNLQQISLNSRIVAVEGTFDHIDANNINATDINIENVAGSDVYLSRSSGQIINNSFINVTFEDSSESFNSCRNSLIVFIILKILLFKQS